LGVKHLHFDGDLTRLNGITASTRHDEKLIRKIWGDALGMTLVVARSTNVDQALAQNDFVAERLAREPGVKGVYSLASVCPSRATQEANIRAGGNSGRASDWKPCVKLFDRLVENSVFALTHLTAFGNVLKANQSCLR